jgi:hypothetical protein
MKFQRSIVFLMIALGGATPAMAQCGPIVAGSTAAEIRANEQRILCLQRELAAETRQRGYELELDTIQRQLRELQTQQQFEPMDVPVYRPSY